MAPSAPPIRRISAVIVASAFAVSGASLAAPSAHAATCFSTTMWTAYNPSNSDVMSTPYNGDCNDLNAAYTFTRTDAIRGWYYSSSNGWQYGSRGFVTVDTIDNNWLVLVSSLYNGTNTRGEGARYSQNVKFVF